jgi:hypothetical protein
MILQKIHAAAIMGGVIIDAVTVCEYCFSELVERR